MNDEEPTGKDM